MTSWRAADERVWGAGAHDHRLPVPGPLADTGQGLSAMATVLQVYKTDFPSVSGGVDTVVCQLLRAQSTEWQQCLLRVAPWQERNPTPTHIEHVVVHALHLPAPPMQRTTLRAWLGFLCGAVTAGWRVMRLLRAASVDLVHLHTLQHYHAYFVLASLLGGPPYVLTLHGSEVEAYGSRDRLTRALWRWTLRHAAALSAVSATLAQRAHQQLPVGAAIDSLRNGVALAGETLPDSSALRARLGLQRPYCVMVGALIEAKGHDVGLRAWSLLPPSCGQLNLLVIGEGERMARYRAEVEQAGLAGRVHFAGQLPHADTLALMRDSALLVLPSRHEGFGLVAIEAGALGVPVVASDLPVFRELLGELGKGCLVAVDDADALAVAVARVLHDEAARRALGRAWRLRVAQEFALSACMTRYQTWYRAALGAHGKVPS